MIQINSIIAFLASYARDGQVVEHTAGDIAVASERVGDFGNHSGGLD